MKKAILFLVLLSALFPMSTALMAQNECTIMQPDLATFKQWMAQDMSLPKAYIDPAIKPKRGSASLLGYLPYIPAERNQGNCGDCWTWAATGCMEIWHNYSYGIADRLSIQFINSCKTDTFPCCGGNPYGFATWYAAQGIAVPWSNSGASFADGGTAPDCSSAPAVACSSISTSPNYPLNSISASLITTTGVGQATAIANIKNVLAQGKAVYWGFWLPRTVDWDNYRNFWNNNNETVLWSPEFCYGATADSGFGGHAELIVGYNDDNLSNQYWIVVNSWGTASGNRPNGINHLKMNINYDGQYYNSGWWPVVRFYTVDVSFGGGPIPTPTPQPPTPTPKPPCPVRVDPDQTSFSAASDQIDLYASTDTLTTWCYPFVRIVTPYYGTYYLTSRLVMYPYPMPYTPYSITTTGPISGLFLCGVWWRNLYPGTYYVESGAVNAYSLSLIGPIYTVPFTLN